jgi:hypothetical protein
MIQKIVPCGSLNRPESGQLFSQLEYLLNNDIAVAQTVTQSP